MIVDGAVDRVAAIAGTDGAVVIAAGADGARSIADAAERAGALAHRLCTPRYDPALPSLRIDGALTPGAASQLIARGERRQVVVRDPTQIALQGKAMIAAATRLALRCERPLNLIAVTAASIGGEGYFEPRAFAKSVREATGLPTFDVYAGAAAA